MISFSNTLTAHFMNRLWLHHVRFDAIDGFLSFSSLSFFSFLFPYTPDSGSEVQTRGPGGGDLFLFRRYLDTYRVSMDLILVLIGDQCIVTSK